MKEHKVATWKIGLTKNNQKLEDCLNEYVRDGWRTVEIGEQSARIIFERDRNR